MTKYEQFVNSVCINLTERLCEKEGVSVEIIKVLKNNDIEYDAVNIRDKNTKISPTIYLNQFFEEYENGTAYDKIVDEIIDIYNKSEKESLGIELDILNDFESVKSRIAYKLINTSMNEKLLKDIPYTPYLDLSIVYYIVVGGHDKHYSTTALIHNTHMEGWGTDVEELHQLAMKNTPDIYPADIRCMDDIIKDMLVMQAKSSAYCDTLAEDDASYFDKIAEEQLEEINSSRECDVKMYVLTNSSGVNGAVSILYEGVLSEFANTKNQNLFLLPSSIHEIIIIPDIMGIDVHELNSMVRDANREAVVPGEILSDHIYYFNKEINQVIIP